MQSQTFSNSEWSLALKDACLMYASIIGVLFALVLMGVPHLAQGFGLSIDPSWQTLMISFLSLLPSAYLIVEVLSDVFSKKSKIMQTPPGKRWKPLTAALVFLILIAILGYSKMSRV